MGLALLILILKTMAIRTGDEHYDRAVRFWARIFGINFAVGVVTGIPMEFQFGTNLAQFSRSAGGVIGQTLAMEGIFSFFLESSFLGLLLFGEKRLKQRGHWVAALMVFLGSWLSGYLIVATVAWMQRPVGYSLGANGEILLSSFWGLLLNRWAIWQYAHTMTAAVVTASFVMTAVGAFYLLSGEHQDYGKTFLRVGVIAGTIACFVQLFPTGDAQGRMVTEHQPVTLAAMEGLFTSQTGAPLVLLGQPDMENQRLDNPLIVPRALSFLTYRHWDAEVTGWTDLPARIGRIKYRWCTTAITSWLGWGRLLHCHHVLGGASTVAREALRVSRNVVDSDAGVSAGHTLPPPPAGSPRKPGGNHG